MAWTLWSSRDLTTEWRNYSLREKHKWDNSQHSLKLDSLQVYWSILVSSATNDTLRGFLIVSRPPVAALYSVIAAISTCGFCPRATSFKPFRGLRYTHRDQLGSLHWRVLNGRVKEISSLFTGWPWWVYIPSLNHNSSIRCVFPPRRRCNFFVCFALAAKKTHKPQNSNVLAVEHLLPSSLPRSCLWMPRLSGSGRCVAFTISSRLLK